MEDSRILRFLCWCVRGARRWSLSSGSAQWQSHIDSISLVMSESLNHKMDKTDLVELIDEGAHFLVPLHEQLVLGGVPQSSCWLLLSSSSVRFSDSISSLKTAILSSASFVALLKSLTRPTNFAWASFGSRLAISSSCWRFSASRRRFWNYWTLISHGN